MSRKLVGLVAVASLLGILTASPAVAGTLYGSNAENSGSGATWFSIDPSDGSLTDINTSTAREIRGLAYDPISQILYGSSGGQRFYSMDPVTGAITDINTNTSRNIGSLAFDATSGRLYGSNGDQVLFEVDPLTGGPHRHQHEHGAKHEVAGL